MRFECSSLDSFEKEYRGSKLVSSTRDGVVLLHDDGSIGFLNPSAESLLGVRAEDVAGKRIWELPIDLIKEDETPYRGDFSASFFSLQTGQSQKGNTVGILKNNGLVTWLSVDVDPVFISPGGEKPVAAAVLFRDITELKKAEQSLRESEEKFHAVAENARAAFGIVQGTRFVYANRFFSEMSGYSTEEILNMDFPQMVHPDFREGMIELARRRQGGQPVPSHYEFRMITKRGEFRWVDFSPAKTEFRGKPAIIGTGFDVTERREAEEALRESQATLQSYYDNSPLLMGIIEVLPDNSDVVQIFDNPSACRFFNLPPNATAGRLASELGVPQDTLQWWIERYRESERKRGPVSFEYQHTRNGEPYWWSVTVSYLSIGKYGGPRLSYVIEDITERKRAEEERLKFEREMTQAQKLESIGILAGGIAHDFNNLLSGIFGHIDLAKQYAEKGLTNNVTAALRNALKSFDRAKDLTAQLLTFSKGGFPVKKIAEVTPIIKSAATFALSGSNVKADINFPNDVWPCEIDEHQFAQAIDNIVRNAKDSMPAGGVVHVTAENTPQGAPPPDRLPQGNYVHISISDQGGGISEEHLKHIFDPFFTTKETGHGLGLSIAYSVVKRHGGAVTVDSEQGRGSTFHIYIPASYGEIVPDFEKQPVQYQGEGKVLVMDDEEAILQLASQALSGLGYSVETAQKGEDAIALYKRALESHRPFDLVILDLTVRDGMGGKDTMAELQKLDPSVSALVSSGYSNDLVMIDPKAYGFKGAIPKPFRLKEMGEALLNALADRAPRSLHLVANR